MAIIAYWPSQYAFDQSGHPVLRRGKIVGSPKFVEKFASIEAPQEIVSGHPWAAARDHATACDGEIALPCQDGPVRLQWQAWWSTYGLLVLLRRKPLLGLVGKLVRA